MAKVTNQGASAPIRKTKFTKFFSSNPQQDMLFAVNGELSVCDALQQAMCFLDAATSAANNAAMRLDAPDVFAVVYLLEMSHAIVHSAIGAVENGEHAHG